MKRSFVLPMLAAALLAGSTLTHGRAVAAPVGTADSKITVVANITAVVASMEAAVGITAVVASMEEAVASMEAAVGITAVVASMEEAVARAVEGITAVVARAVVARAVVASITETAAYLQL
jgi:hypothetical protein